MYTKQYISIKLQDYRRWDDESQKLDKEWPDQRNLNETCANEVRSVTHSERENIIKRIDVLYLK